MLIEGLAELVVHQRREGCEVGLRPDIGLDLDDGPIEDLTTERDEPDLEAGAHVDREHHVSWALGLVGHARCTLPGARHPTSRAGDRYPGATAPPHAVAARSVKVPFQSADTLM